LSGPALGPGLASLIVRRGRLLPQRVRPRLGRRWRRVLRLYSVRWLRTVRRCTGRRRRIRLRLPIRWLGRIRWLGQVLRLARIGRLARIRRL
jgi:hypothetical protein